MKTKHHFFSYVILAVIIIFFVSLPFIFPGIKSFASPDFIRSFILGFGFFAFIIYALLVTLSVPFNIPSTPIVLAGGYIFGSINGLVLSLVGMVLGSTLAFYLTRIGGKPLLEKWVDPHHLDHLNKVFSKRGKVAILISYAIPLFPSDAVSLFLGLTKMKYRSFLFLVFFGHIPRLLIVILLGADFYSGFSLRTVIVLIASLLFILLVVFREKIKRFIFKELHRFEEISLFRSIFGAKNMPHKQRRL